MIPDIRFEADVLRAALLLGLVREFEAIAWADDLLAAHADRHGLIADVAIARPELTALREALRPLAEPFDEQATAAAILTFLAVDQAAGRLSAYDMVGVLSHLRREFPVSAAIGEDIKHFEDRLMLASAGMRNEHAPTRDELARWLNAARTPAYYRFSFERDEERAAFLGALSRKIVRDRRWQPRAGTIAARSWVVASAEASGATLLVSETLWKIAVTEFSPLPVASRLPYAAVPLSAIAVLDERTATPLGAEDASARLAAL